MAGVNARGLPIMPLLVAAIGGSVTAITADNRLEAPRLQGATGVSGYSGVTGVGSRRQLPKQFSLRSNVAEGRRFEHSFDLRTNAQFSAHNIDDVSERMRSESLYNNPWYWQNVGSLDTELMTGGSGVPVAAYEADGDYYNPYFYDQWRTSDGQRHSGSMTGEINRGWRFEPSTENSRTDRRDGPAVLPGTNAPLSPPTTQTQHVGELAADRTVLAGDRLGTTLRSDIDSSWSGRSVRVLGNGLVGGSTPVRYQGSGLRGLSTAPMQSATDSGLTSYDVARLKDDQLSGRLVPAVGSPWETRFKDLAVSSTRMTNRADGSPPPMPASPDLTATYQAMADRYASLHPSSMSMEDRLDALDRDYRRFRGGVLSGDVMGDDDARLVPSSPPEGEGLGTQPGEPETSEESEVPEPSAIDQPPSALSWSDYGLVLRHGQRIDAFSVGDQSRFDDLMAAASQKLAEREYLRSERRFNRALRFVRGHPLATAGMGHAQLGAGLYLSSALTLQSLLAFQPEMIDVQYAPSLLPDQKDLDRAISVLTQRIQGDADLDRYGLLLAYIGHQLDREKLVADGLAAMERGGADEQFVKMLRDIWGPGVNAANP